MAFVELQVDYYDCALGVSYLSSFYLLYAIQYPHAQLLRFVTQKDWRARWERVG
jgi:hypothetical protein